MTMNVAGGALALMLCLTVTSSQQAFGNKETTTPSTEISFTTETKNDTANEVSFEKNDINLVTLYNDETEAVETADVETTDVETTNLVEETKENRWGIRLTEDEIELLAKILWVEARGESVRGQEAVVEVILNRIASEKFPNTLYEVLSEKNPVQFASWKLRDTAEPTAKEYTSIQTVLEGNTNILREDTLYFATKKLTRNLDVQIGGHYFCYK